MTHTYIYIYACVIYVWYYLYICVCVYTPCPDTIERLPVKCHVALVFFTAWITSCEAPKNRSAWGAVSAIWAMMPRGFEAPKQGPKTFKTCHQFFTCWLVDGNWMELGRYQTLGPIIFNLWCNQPEKFIEIYCPAAVLDDSAYQNCQQNGEVAHLWQLCKENQRVKDDGHGLKKPADTMRQMSWVKNAICVVVMQPLGILMATILSSISTHMVDPTLDRGNFGPDPHEPCTCKPS